jgi:phosphatidylserine decarboxylase
MNTPQPIRYWNRDKRTEETEAVYGEAAVGWLYGTQIGQVLADGVLSRRLPSRLYGAYQASSMSRHKVRPFVEKFKIPMDEYEKREFNSFNDFFIRKFRDGARRFESTPGRMPAYSEARYFAFDRVDSSLQFPVKGQWLTAKAVLEDAALAAPFEGGPMLLARLCPTDYHRFHFPDDGKIIEQRRLAGKLHSVNPLALRYKGEILATNERHVSILETKNFGRLAYVEVGALCVGKIIQTHTGNPAFRRGDEKGYFLFGASTVIVFGEPGRWKPDADLLEQTSKQRETLIRLGEPVASVL